MKSNLRHNTITLLYSQWQSLMNYVSRVLKNDPIFISLIILIPCFFYIVMELSVSSSLSIYALNPNLLELFNSYPILFHRIISYLIVVIPPVYIFMIQISIKLYNKMSATNINYKTISLANLSIFLIGLDFVFVAALAAILMKTQSTLISILFFICLMLFTINSIIIILCLLFIMIVNRVVQYVSFNIFVIECFMLLLITSILLFAIINIPYEIIFQLSSIVIIATELLLLLLVFKLYSKFKITSQYVLRSSHKKNKVIKANQSISIPSNYLLMLYNNKKIFIEYILSIIILFVVLKVAYLLSEMNEIIYQLSIPMLLIPNGLICSYINWYHLYNKKVFNKVRVLDMIFMTILSLVLYFVISLALGNPIKLINLLVYFGSYFICMVIQWKIKLKFNNQSSSYFTYIMIYGTLAYLLYTLINFGISYV